MLLFFGQYYTVYSLSLYDMACFLISLWLFVPIVPSACILDFVPSVTVLSRPDINWPCPVFLGCLCLMLLYLTIRLVLTLASILILSLPSDWVPHCLAVDELWLVPWLCSCLLIRYYHVPASESYLVVIMESVLHSRQLTLPSTLPLVPHCVLTTPATTTRDVEQGLQEKPPSAQSPPGMCQCVCLCVPDLRPCPCTFTTIGLLITCSLLSILLMIFLLYNNWAIHLVNIWPRTSTQDSTRFTIQFLPCSFSSFWLIFV